MRSESDQFLLRPFLSALPAGPVRVHMLLKTYKSNIGKIIIFAKINTERRANGIVRVYMYMPHCNIFEMQQSPVYTSHNCRITKSNNNNNTPRRRISLMYKYKCVHAESITFYHFVHISPRRQAYNINLYNIRFCGEAVRVRV